MIAKNLKEGERCCVILLNYNGWEDTVECIESLLKLTLKPVQIIVVDNNSPNSSFQEMLRWANGDLEVKKDDLRPEIINRLIFPSAVKPLNFRGITADRLLQQDNLKELDSDILFISNPENKGFAAGNNVGINYVLQRQNVDHLWILNTDIVVGPDTLSKLVESAQQYKLRSEKVGIIGCKLLYYYQPDLIQGVGGRYNRWLATSNHVGAFERDCGQLDGPDSLKYIDYPLGASMFVSSEYIKDVGFLCEDYFLYYEEMDWVLRGKKNGWEIGYQGSVSIYHKEGAVIGSSSEGRRKSDLSEFYSLRNRLVFTRKFFPQKIIIVYASFFLVALNRIRRREFSRLKIVWNAIRSA